MPLIINSSNEEAVANVSIAAIQGTAPMSRVDEMLATIQSMERELVTIVPGTGENLEDLAAAIETIKRRLEASRQLKTLEDLNSLLLRISHHLDDIRNEHASDREQFYSHLHALVRNTDATMNAARATNWGVLFIAIVAAVWSVWAGWAHYAEVRSFFMR